MKIIIILLIIAVISFIVAKLSGESTEDAGSIAITAVGGCFSAILQLLIFVGTIWLAIVAVKWLIS